MDFSQIPKLAYERGILPYLDWNDLLRLRRVCTSTRDAVNDYIRLKENASLIPEIEINEDDKVISEFLKMKIPTTRIFLNNLSGNKFFESKKNWRKIAQFVQRYSPLVRHLRVTQISAFLHGKELHFLEAFVNLQSFEAGFFGGWDERHGMLSKEEIDEFIDKQIRLSLKVTRNIGTQTGFLIPNIFSSLESLKIGNHSSYEVVNANMFTETALDSSLLSEHLALPFSSDKMDLCTLEPKFHQFQDVDRHPMFLFFNKVASYIKYRAKASTSAVNLKSFDFISYHINDKERRLEQEWRGSAYFLLACGAALEFNVELLNVGAYWFQAFGGLPDLENPNLGIPIVSMVGIHPCAFGVNMPNLEEIEIRRTSENSPGVDWRVERPEWPALKRLKINVDSVNGQSSEWIHEMQIIVHYHVTSTKTLFQFFFQGIVRSEMRELHLKFTNVRDGGVAVPKVEEIVSSCPNLRKLTLIMWPGTNKALTKLWRGLPCLEEISLEYCKDLGNVAFVGEDVENPVFLNLTKLKKLTLKGLDSMPKISDTLFTLVIRRMRLTHLILASRKPVASVTLAGVQSLLKAQFAESIVKFPFQNWSLANVSRKEFQETGKLFRSYNMM